MGRRNEQKRSERNVASGSGGAERRFERAWVAHGFLRELILIYPVYSIMMGQHGMDPFRLSLLFALWSATVVVLEVPSGTLADLVSRRTLLVASGLIKACSYPVWLLLPGFFGYLLGFFLWGWPRVCARGPPSRCSTTRWREETWLPASRGSTAGQGGGAARSRAGLSLWWSDGRKGLHNTAFTLGGRSAAGVPDRDPLFCRARAYWRT